LYDQYATLRLSVDEKKAADAQAKLAADARQELMRKLLLELNMNAAAKQMLKLQQKLS
jgi:hypothetical protein